MDNRSQRRLPDVIYLRRRVAAAVALILVIIIGLVVMTKCGSSDQPHNTGDSMTTTTPASSSVPVSTETSEKVASREKDSAETSSSVASPTTTVVSTAPVKDSCELSDLIVTATSDQAVYYAGQYPLFYLTVENPTNADCVIDFDKDVLHFEVYDLATNRRVWADVDCNLPEATGVRTFKAGQSAFYQAQWSRTLSAPGQCEQRLEAPNGGYYLHTLVGTNHSDAHTFNLE